MKLPTLLTRKTLRAATARRSLGVPDEMDYEEMSEPNMKLSRALLIVLVLHVVAVAGIIAFNAIKSRQGSLPPISTARTEVSRMAPAKNSAPAESVTPRDEAALKPAPKPVAKEERKAIPVKPVAEVTTAKSESKKTYVVAKGDTPVMIARKFKIPFDQLLAANKIDDPHKLRVGQKLVIPTKPAKPKKTD
jgi:LysM repeat protein